MFVIYWKATINRSAPIEVRYARPRQLILLLVRRAARRGARVPPRGHPRAPEPRGPPPLALGRHSPRVGLLQGVDGPCDRGREEERRPGEAVARRHVRPRTGAGRGRDDPLGRLLDPERGEDIGHPVQGGRHRRHNEGGQVELPVRRLPQVVQGEASGVPGVRLPAQGLQEEAITGRGACT